MTAFGDLVAQYRKAAVPWLSQEGLARAIAVDTKTISNIERGTVQWPQKDTVRRLVDHFGLTGDARKEFEAAARQRDAPWTVERAVLAGPPRGDNPHTWLAFIVATLDERGVAAARAAVGQWQARTAVDGSWLDWVDRLLELTGDGRLPRATQRPLPASDPSVFLAREQETASLAGFLDRVRQGRGGLTLIMGPSGIGKSRLAAKVLPGWTSDCRTEWVTLDRGEAGYQGWRRLLSPLWATVRRTELAPASLAAQSRRLDDILLPGPGQAARRFFRGEVAAAIAALLAQVSVTRPVVLVIDDAQRGGISSDQLLLEVARRVNAFSVGIIAAFRPDELDPGSPLRGYCDQAGDRDGTDVVMPLHVPPLDFDSIAALLEKRHGVPPPPAVVEEVAQQTSGRPQLIKSIGIQRPPDGSRAHWVVRGFGAEGQHVLHDTLSRRPAEVQELLRAAAVCADGKHAEPGMIAALTGQPAGAVMQVLDDERRLGLILSPGAERYCFQHDSWTEAILSSCPAPVLNGLHARCLELLRDEWSADPRKLAWHAVEAGAELAGREEVAGLAQQAADLNIADYAFSDAAGYYEIAARHASGPSQIDFLIRQSDALRFCGRWREARDVLKRAAYLAGRFRLPEREAVALIHLERLTWTYGLDERELTQQLRNVMAKLPPGAQGLLAQVQGALALRLCIVPRQREDEQADLARAALQRLPAVTDPLARADILLGVRGGLQDNAPPGQLLEYDAQVLDNGVAAHSAYHIGEALECRITDLLRAGRISELPAALREHRDFLERSSAPTFHYYQALADALLALARGDWAEAESAVKEGTRVSEEWGESMAGEALMAQAAWQLFETGETKGLTEFLDSLPTREVSSLNGPVWELGAGLIHAENGEADLAIGSLRDVCGRTSDLRAVPRGPARSAILATAITVLGHPAVCEVLPAGEAARLGAGAAGLLADHPDAFVLAGWPAVLLGSKHRYIGLAWLAAQQPERAERHLVQAVDENRDFGVLQTRSQFDLARARMRLPGRYQRGRTELGRARERAAALGMQGLVRQADSERERQPPPAG